MGKPILCTFFALTIILTCGIAGAQEGGQTPTLSHGSLKIGMLTDMSGAYKQNTGPGAALAVKMAIKDFGGEVLGEPIELLVADHQNNASKASTIARKWIDRDNVDMIVGMGNSAVGLAVQGLAAEKGIITINTGAGTTKLTGDQCTKYGIHYTYSTHSSPVGTATAIVNNGGDSWFFITTDYAFGHSLQENTAKVVNKLGGKVVGGVEVPLGTSDFASYLIQAKASGAEVIGLANAGSDFVNAVKQAHAFHIVEGGQKLAGLLAHITDVKALGVNVAQGLMFTTAFYWNRTEDTRKWSKRFFSKHGAMPTDMQAGAYSATLAYLKAVKKAGTDDSNIVRGVLGSMTINDMFVQGGHILPNGLMMHDMYLLQVKSPESSEGWDVLKVVSTIPGEKAFIPMSQSGCPLLNK